MKDGRCFVRSTATRLPPKARGRTDTGGSTPGNASDHPQPRTGLRRAGHTGEKPPTEGFGPEATLVGVARIRWIASRGRPSAVGSTPGFRRKRRCRFPIRSRRVLGVGFMSFAARGSALNRLPRTSPNRHGSCRAASSGLPRLESNEPFASPRPDHKRGRCEPP